MVLALAAGIALGVSSKLVDYVAPAWAGNSLALWLLVAFLVGLGATSMRDAVARGCTTLVVANCAYYAWRLFVSDDVGVRWTIRAFSFWTALAIPAGAVAAVVARRGRVGLALPAGGFGGEAIFAAATDGKPGRVIVTAVVATVLAVATSWTQRGVWVAGAGAVAVAGAIAVRRLVLP